MSSAVQPLLYGQTTFCLYICWWTFELFPLILIMNSAAVNIAVQVSLWMYVFSEIGGDCVTLSGAATLDSPGCQFCTVGFT